MNRQEKRFPPGDYLDDIAEHEVIDVSDDDTPILSRAISPVVDYREIEKTRCDQPGKICPGVHLDGTG